jgi:hypothetical protein
MSPAHYRKEEPVKEKVQEIEADAVDILSA